VEEARGRIWASATSPDPITNCVFPSGPPMQVGQVCYITNPANGEAVDPANLDPANPYADTEYQQEWNAPTGSVVNQIASQSATAGIAGPLYKWVRITPRTDASAKFSSDNSPLFFDGGNSNSTGSTAQVFTITSLAVTPSKSRRMVEYTIAPSSLASALPSFPAALTLDGNGVSFTGPSSGNGNGNGNGGSTFQISGTDGNAASGVPAIGFTNSGDGSNITANAVPASAYSSPMSPSVSMVSLPQLLQSPTGLDALTQSITQSADLVLNPTAGTVANQTSLTAMSATNPMVVVVNGDFHLTHSGGNGPFTGYGLLLVTGTLQYDPDDSWYGVILVIGKGVFDGSQHGNGGQIYGSVFVADTRDSFGNLLTNLGPASFNLTGGGNGIQYSSAWVKTAQAGLPYQILSFREIPLTTP
jgi:hypothetical protein